MICPFCNYTETKVIDSRVSLDTPVIRRRRECLKCEKRFTTYEKIEEPKIIVIKKNGNKEEFNRNKLILGLKKACNKRDISDEEIEKIALKIELTLKEKDKKEVKTEEIGKLVLRELKKIDKLAYIRFASVYENFDNVEEFYNYVSRFLGR